MNATTHTTPFYLAEVTDAAGSTDPSFARGRHVYVRLRNGLVDVRGAGGVWARLTIRQAAARLRTVRTADGAKVLVRNQQRYDEECTAYHEAAYEWRHRRPMQAA